eukprot:TRINITY_DN20081_c0_g1_i1.p3 TRINITY_DN20081_c0_g1~~TRINITY_DN20081_c0_g1_i1.p3  ORF type:complete len:133 (-),score=64.37 TRINITY_DN20081_c0_g1_i1:111-509(-)
MPYLTVGVVEARGLLNADSGKNGDVSDPFVRVFCSAALEGIQQTRCIQDNLDPVWNDQFLFELDPARMVRAVLDVWVLDKDFLWDDDLGRAKVNLADLTPGQKYDKWVPLVLDSGKTHGQIRLQLHLQDMAN